jgi:ESCRT-II complex subunit VPS25
MNDFVKSGNGEWEDSESRTRCRILWRRPEQLAEDIYDWAIANGYKNSVCTVYELHSGECLSFQTAWQTPGRT